MVEILLLAVIFKLNSQFISSESISSKSKLNKVSLLFSVLNSIFKYKNISENFSV